MSLGEQNGVESLLVIGMFPIWIPAFPPGLIDWRNYVRTLATRYRGRVKFYELWNEPKIPVEQLVEVCREAYQIIKSVDPAATVVSPAIVWNPKYLEVFLAEGGGQYCDVLAYHFYVGAKPPEAMAQRIVQVKSLMQKYGLTMPIWNTETGWRILNHDKNYELDVWAGAPLSDADSMAYVARSYLISWALGIERLYWYAWGNRSMGMTEDDLRTPKPICTAYTQVRDWMLGAELNSRTIDGEGNWICPLTRAGGYRAWAAWNPGATISFSVPEAWEIKQERDLYGNRRPLAGVTSVEVGSLPILLENRTR